MTPARKRHSAHPGPSVEVAELRARLAESEETLRAIRTGEVDAVVVAGKVGPQVFTLEGAEHSYRMLIESMNEGALTLTADKTILYANQCFARMVKWPLEQLIGSSFGRFLSPEDRATLRPLVKQAGKSGSKIQMLLTVGDGLQVPVHISIRPLAKRGSQKAVVGMVLTDMTETRRTEELLRALTRRVVQVQEAERGRVAVELHENITQLLCAILIRCHTLDKQLSHDAPARAEALKLREMCGQAAREVERISRHLRPSILDDLGLVAVLQDTCREFTGRTGVALKLTCVKLAARLPADMELTLYRILQEVLKNVERHARARHVTVCLGRQNAFIQLVIKDDGAGFDPEQGQGWRNGAGGFGLLGLSERATNLGGTLRIKSVLRAGTEIEVRVPYPPSAAGDN